MVVRWTLTDPTVPETYTFPMNPNEGGTPGITKKITSSVTAAADGQALVFEGRPDPQKFTFSGSILDESHLESLIYWFQKEHQLQLTDDLGRQYWVYLTSFTPTRQRRASHPWRHTYQAEATILDVTT
jgi:hypothetical protein